MTTDARARGGDRWARRALATDAGTLARRLLGARLVRVLDDGTRLAGIIVEAEAYLGVEDRASHAFAGRRTPRNEAMYGPPGTAYVYFTYGIHWCFNVVCGRAGVPAAVLVRALEPTEGLDAMRTRREAKPRKSMLRDTDLCSGPARLCQAMGIDRALNGVDLVEGPRLFIERGTRFDDADVGVGPRVGIGSAGAWTKAPLRWAVRRNPHVSVAIG